MPTGSPVYKDDFTINNGDVPVCYSTSQRRKEKIQMSKINFARGNVTCTCENPCSDTKYDLTAHLVMKGSPRLFNAPPTVAKSGN